MIYQHYEEYLPWLWMLRGMEIESYLEIGTSGGFSIAVARRMLPGRVGVATLDIRNERQIMVDGVDYRIGNSHDPAVAAAYGGQFDAVFVDGDHIQDGVAADIRVWWPMAKMVIGFHDVDAEPWPGVGIEFGKLPGLRGKIAGSRPNHPGIGYVIKAMPHSLPVEGV